MLQKQKGNFYESSYFSLKGENAKLFFNQVAGK